MKILSIVTLLSCFLSTSSYACSGRSKVTANSEKVFETKIIEIYKLSGIDYSIGCNQWAISVNSNKTKLCRSILGKGKGIQGKISYLSGSATSTDQFETVYGKPGLDELLCTVIKP